MTSSAVTKSFQVSRENATILHLSIRIYIASFVFVLFIGENGLMIFSFLASFQHETSCNAYKKHAI
jgi:hypothetical protein